jgi:hypothetical protein
MPGPAKRSGGSPLHREFIACSDALRAEMALLPRGPDGYYEPAISTATPAEMWHQSARHSEELSRAFGDAAVDVLRGHGLRARLNAVGHVAVEVPVA